MQECHYRQEKEERKQGKKLLSAHDAYRLLVGEVGIPRNEFLYDLKLWEINAIVEGYRNRAHTAWETARWQTFCIVCAMGAKNINSPQDIQKFPWEDEEQPYEEITEEERDEILRDIENINEQLRQQREKDRQDNNPLQ